MKNLPSNVLERLRKQGKLPKVDQSADVRRDETKAGDKIEGELTLPGSTPGGLSNEAKIRKHEQNGGNDGFEFCTSCMPPKGENE